MRKGFLAEIADANEKEIREILYAVWEKYRVLYPDWDFIFLTLPVKDREERERLLKLSWDILQREQ